ncbi:helix-turn-helix transcriptional regulator [Nonomuraea angiospora]|uniref:helix-turn-helix transcriptional regulator n=1 Tax=Nonomuraea angiospora TaxID=46172 RepID=UPI003424C98D
MLIRTWREQALLTQDELAHRAGLNARTIRRLEAGEPRRPRGTSISTLAEALGLDAAEQARLITAALRLPARPARTGAGGPSRAMTVLCQLPCDTAHFVGRRKELCELDGTARGPATDAGPKVLAVLGGAGIGKTALAVHWAHRVADRFPDGQLYANLRGFEPGAEPAHPAEAIRGFLTALGVPSRRIPAGTDARGALFRSTVNGRRLLIVLDNARAAGQVRPLLPGAGGCLVIVTSRDQLTGLVAAGAAPIVLDPLPASDALRLLARRLGPARLAAAPEAAGKIAALCSGLPLALAVAAARASTHPRFSLDDLAAELHGTGNRLDALSDKDPFADVRTALSWSYRTLGPAAARTFRLLGLHPGHDIDVAAAADLCGLPVRETRALLAELHRVHLIAEPAPGRYAQHDLVRAYAAELAETHESPAERHEAECRLFDHYVRTGVSTGRSRAADNFSSSACAAAARWLTSPQNGE